MVFITTVKVSVMWWWYNGQYFLFGTNSFSWSLSPSMSVSAISTHLRHVPPMLWGLLQWALHLHFKVQYLHILEQFYNQPLFHLTLTTTTLSHFLSSLHHPKLSPLSLSMFQEINIIENQILNALSEGTKRASWSLLPELWQKHTHLLKHKKSMATQAVL